MSKQLTDFPHFVMLSDEERIKATENEVDVLTSEVKAEAEFFERASCPRCGNSPLTPILDTKTPFTPGRILPKKLLECANCRTTIEPYSGITVKEGGVPDDVQRMSRMFLRTK